REHARETLRASLPAPARDRARAARAGAARGRSPHGRAPRLALLATRCGGPPVTRLLVVALAAVSVGWLDPWGKARQAARLYAAGKYDDAVGRYDEALTDQPDSALLHFNRGDAAYRQGKYGDAVN